MRLFIAKNYCFDFLTPEKHAQQDLHKSSWTQALPRIERQRSSQNGYNFALEVIILTYSNYVEETLIAFFDKNLTNPVWSFSGHLTRHQKSSGAARFSWWYFREFTSHYAHRKAMI